MQIIVTGATAGLGEQIARDFVAAGHTVYGTGRRLDKLTALKESLGDRFIPLCFDVCDSQAISKVLGRIELDKIDVLINNAGLTLGLEPAHLADIEPGMCGGTQFSQVRFKGDNTKAAAVYEGVEYLTASDISNTVQWVASQPWHVNINAIELMPTAQTYAGLAIARDI